MIGAVLAGPRNLGVRELPDPEPGFGEVRVRVARAGLCGSDVHVWKTGEFVTRFPVVPGHEVAGVIEKVGEGCEYLASRRVVLDSRVPRRSPGRSAFWGLGQQMAPRDPVRVSVGAIGHVFVARPTGVGRALTAYRMPIEGRDEWVAAAARLA